MQFKFNSHTILIQEVLHIQILSKNYRSTEILYRIAK